MKYIVYTEIIGESAVERWYYGSFNNCDRACDAAELLGNSYPVFHCVCEISEAKVFNIQNLPF